MFKFLRKLFVRSCEPAVVQKDDCENCVFTMEQEDHIKDLKNELNMAQEELHDTQQALDNVRTVNRTFAQMMLQSGIDPQQVYEALISGYDPEGFALYSMAEKLTGVCVTSYFYTEDVLGYFEDMDGFRLLGWLESATYGDIEWAALPGPGCYEKAAKRTIYTDSEEYMQYRRTLFEATVKKLLKLNDGTDEKEAAVMTNTKATTDMDTMKAAVNNELEDRMIVSLK